MARTDRRPNTDDHADSGLSPMWINEIDNKLFKLNLNWLFSEVEFSESGGIDGGVGERVDAHDGDVLEVEQAVQTQDEDEDGNDHYRHKAGTKKRFGVKGG